MPLSNNLPKGCSTTRGVSYLHHIGAQGGGLAYHTNRLYMLNVQRESLMNKKQSLESRLKDIKSQLQGLEASIRETERQYKKVSGNGSRKKRHMENSITEEKGRRQKVKKMSLKF